MKLRDEKLNNLPWGHEPRSRTTSAQEAPRDEKKKSYNKLFDKLRNEVKSLQILNCLICLKRKRLLRICAKKTNDDCETRAKATKHFDIENPLIT